MPNKHLSLDSLTIASNLLVSYANFLQEIISIEEEHGIEVLKNSMEELPKTIEHLNSINPKLGNKVAIWTIKLLAVANSMSKIQSLNLKQKKELVQEINLVSKELVEIKEEFGKYGGK
jgi:hypothetical protein